MQKSGDRIRIGHLSTLYHTAFILRGARMLEEKGITAEWHLFASGPDIIAAMESGRIDLGYVGLPPIIIGIGRGMPLACIAGGHVEGTVMVAGPGIRTLDKCLDFHEFLSQFTGKSIGTPPKGSIHDVIVRDLLNSHGITGAEVKNYPWADFLPDALAQGEIAAAAGTPALAVTAQRFGNAMVAVPPSRLWPFNPSYGIVIMRSMLARRGLLSGFLQAHEAACELIRAKPREAARIVAEATGMVDERFVLDCYRISPRYCASLQREYVASTMKFAATLHALGYTPRVIREDEVFERSLIQEVHPGPHHYSDGIAPA
jgi:NitT/TauT family transport system substrate-binding protein